MARRYRVGIVGLDHWYAGLAATAEDAGANLAVGEACYRAGRDGRAVTL